MSKQHVSQPGSALFLEKLRRARNIGISAHVDAGKTTATERFLYHAGKKHKIGNIGDGDTTTDFMKQERDRGITIQSAAVSLSYQPAGYAHPFEINLIDTPGHVDFTMEVERSMRVLDGCIAVLGTKGVEPQTGTVWRQATKYGVPRLVFVNKMDMVSADFHRVVESVKTNLKAKVAVIQLPIGQSDTFRGVVDLINNVALLWDETDETGSTFSKVAVPEDMREAVDAARKELIEVIAEAHDHLLEKYFAGEEITVSELKAALRADTISMRLFPVLCGSAYKNKGMQPLLDAVVDYLPSPLDVPAVKGVTPDGSEDVRETSDNAPLSALAFKVLTDTYGTLTFVRVYSGVLTSGERVFNATRGWAENVSRLVKLQGNKREEVDTLMAGDIGAIIGCKDTRTGDTLCTEDDQILLETITVPQPVVAQAIEAADKATGDKLSSALEKLCNDDPSFQRFTDPETNQTIIRGMGELHLEVKVQLLREDFGLKVNLGEPQVTYREAIRGIATGVGEHKKQSGGKGQYGKVMIRIEPLPSGTGFVFEDATVGGSVPREFIRAIEKGIRNTLTDGVLAGYPIIDLKAILTDGKSHEVDSNDMSFMLAARLALRDAFVKPEARATLLEPIMAVSVVVPDEYMGDIIGDISSRRGRVLGSDSISGDTIVKALVPIATMFGYSNTLRGRTKGNGTFSMELAQYEPVPASIAEEIKERSGK